MAPLFTGLRLGFGSGGGGGGLSGGTLSASGGAVYTQGDYKLHVFTFPNSDNFVVTDATPNATVEIMMIGSGGSGCPDQGNGGGGGGLVWTNNGGIVISDGTYPVTISGASQNYAPSPGNPVNARGGDTIFNPGGSGVVLTAKGGGFGGYFSPYTADQDYRTGGCGGGMGNMPGAASVPDYGHPTYGPGGAQEYQTTEPQTLPTATNILGNTATVLSQGFEGGGADSNAITDPSGSGGGGGGAGERGYAGHSHSGVTPSNNWGRGGDGYQVPSDFLDPFKPVIPNPFLNIGHSDPAFRYFGGGGGGSDYNNNSGSARNFGVPGGLGGGGRGAQDPGPGTRHGEVGLDGRGGGGGGGSTHSGNGRSGGSGCCIIKYKFQ
jgi:autotransporter family porin